MSNVVHFCLAPSFASSVVSRSEAEEIQALLSEVLTSCPACDGVGHFTHKHPVSGTIACSPCPCGGTDEDRIDLNDFGGAA